MGGKWTGCFFFEGSYLWLSGSYSGTRLVCARAAVQQGFTFAMSTSLFPPGLTKLSVQVLPSLQLQFLLHENKQLRVGGAMREKGQRPTSKGKSKGKNGRERENGGKQWEVNSNYWKALTGDSRWRISTPGRMDSLSAHRGTFLSKKNRAIA